jgi:hypothetical protein
VIVLQVTGIGTVSDRPLSPLFDGEEAKLAVAFAGRCLSLPHLWANAFWRSAGAIADKQNFLEAWDRLLGAANDNCIANRGAVAQHVFVDCLECREAAAFRGSRHHGSHGLARDKRSPVRHLAIQCSIRLSGVILASHIHVFIVVVLLDGFGRFRLRRGWLLLGLFRLLYLLYL